MCWLTSIRSCLSMHLPRKAMARSGPRVRLLCGQAGDLDVDHRGGLKFSEAARFELRTAPADFQPVGLPIHSHGRNDKESLLARWAVIVP